MCVVGFDLRSLSEPSLLEIRFAMTVNTSWVGRKPERKKLPVGEGGGGAITGRR